MMDSSKTKYYAVKRGRTTGVFASWAECKKQTLHFSGAQFKSFATQDAALAYLGQTAPVKRKPDDDTDPQKDDEVVAHEQAQVQDQTPQQATSRRKRTRTKKDKAPPPIVPGAYVVEFDGASRGNPGPAGCGYCIRSPDPENKLLVERGWSIPDTTNNVAEFTAALEGLKDAEARGCTNVTLNGDSQLVIRALEGRYNITHPNIAHLAAELKAVAARLDQCVPQHAYRVYNKAADQLANDGIDVEGGVHRVTTHQHAAPDESTSASELEVLINELE